MSPDSKEPRVPLWMLSTALAAAGALAIGAWVDLRAQVAELRQTTTANNGAIQRELGILQGKVDLINETALSRTRR